MHVEQIIIGAVLSVQLLGLMEKENGTIGWAATDNILLPSSHLFFGHHSWLNKAQLEIKDTYYNSNGCKDGSRGTYRDDIGGTFPHTQLDFLPLVSL